MSAIRDQISAELKAAMKNRDKDRLATVRLIKAEILKAETAKSADELDEQGLIKLLQTMKKQRLDSIAQFEKGGRPELADKERVEISVIETFLPKQLSDDEVTAMIDEIVIEMGVSDMKGMGPVMKEAGIRAAGRADGKRLSAAVRARLS
ncbi:MAG: GatB/YqeY domain-containing protein [Acidobacteriota bacterium]|nr:GatB/YqeY domain-containing protein [Acidobacteriota bacterium]